MKVLKAFRWGEALLWAGFVVSAFVALDDNGNAVTLAGIFALAAIGVRATREEPVRGYPENE